MAMNLKQASEMVAMARKTNTFYMEGMWSRFFPATHKVLELIQSGVIGDVKFVEADFGFAAPVNLEGRIYNKALGGGAQLDVGVYPMFFALLLLGKPDGIKAFSQLSPTGVDITTSALFNYKSGAIAHIFSSVVADSPKEAHILGTLGRITLHAAWHKSQKVTVRMNTDETSTFSFPHSGNGFEFQLEEVVRCIQEKKSESELMPHQLSLMMAEVSDEIRRQGGVKYPVD
jgi:predicted dehydrogenase